MKTKDAPSALSIKTYISAVTKGEISVLDTARDYKRCIEEKNDSLNAFLEVFDDIGIQANRVQDRMKEGENLSLPGVCFAVKDNILIKGRRASAASKILSGYEASYDATVISKLKDAGAIFLGRTNMDEFAMGSSTENSSFGPTKNPHDVSRVPGGSSGGSAAAIAAGLAQGALGSDTGGSIRQPASFCGVVGLKPTYGRVSRYGLIAMASSLDQIGPLAKSVEDVEIIYNVIRGIDERDATSVSGSDRKKTKTHKIALPKKFLEEGVGADVLQNFYESVDVLKKNGYTIEEVDIPEFSWALPVYYILMPAEVSSNLARFDGIRYGISLEGNDHIDRYFKTRGTGFGREARRRILLGTYVLSAGYYDAYYKKAQDARAGLRQSLYAMFKNFDALIMPTSPTPAFRFGEKTSDPITMYLSDIFTVVANLAEVPAISIPSGTVLRDGKNLPVSIQLLGDKFCEDTLFEIGKSFEKHI